MANTNFFFYFAPPEQPLYTAPPPTSSQVFLSEKTEVEYSKEKLKAGSFSILTTFLSILGVGVDVSADLENSEGEVYSFKRIETTQFIPTEDYIQKCIETEAVRRFLERCRYRKAVYVITGLKVVYGAKAKSYTSRAHGGAAAVAVDGTIWSGGAAPVSVEPGVEGRLETSKGTAWEGSSDFIFAFRVRKVHVSKQTSLVDRNEDYTKGAMLGDNFEEIAKDLPELSISSQEDPSPEDEGYSEENLREGETVVACAIPRVDDSEVE
ncbi:hypothetical protein UCREL1_10658 [Eutypa lata UCREL1]|uniref:Uncharacterized protein n=1 Tax=Eutypa lata (strain UCR-EL1) TaxID=1287681 RepID=M7SDX0_EUTLA|nr:hypothetical protein UCREL1_10658 [Eutypa lata UCREL1]